MSSRRRVPGNVSIRALMAILALLVLWGGIAPGQSTTPARASFLNDSRRVLLARIKPNTEAFVLDTGTGAHAINFDLDEGEYTAIASSGVAGRLALGDEFGNVYMYSAASGARIRQLNAPVGSIRFLRFSDTGGELGAVLNDNTLIVWQLYNPPRSRQTRIENAPIRCLDFGGEAGIVVAGLDDGTIVGFDWRTNRIVLKTREFDSPVTSILMTPIRPRKDIAMLPLELAAGSLNGVVRTFHRESGSERRRIAGHSARITAMDVTSDGRTAVSADADGRLISWSPTSGIRRAEFLGHHAAIEAVDISMDDRALVSISADGTVRTWDLGSGMETGVFLLDTAMEN